MIRQTSIEIYHEIRDRGLLSKMRLRVYEILFNHGPLTARQVEAHGAMASKSAMFYHQRLSELRDRGVIEEVGTTSCPVSGNEVILWDVTANLPRKIDNVKQPTRNELIDALCFNAEIMIDHLNSQANVPERWRDWCKATQTVVNTCKKYRKKKAVQKNDLS